MQTFPCGHRVVCRKCFVKTIQMVVSQRLLPLRCVICRAKVIRLKQTDSTFNGIYFTGNAAFHRSSGNGSIFHCHHPQHTFCNCKKKFEWSNGILAERINQITITEQCSAVCWYCFQCVRQAIIYSVGIKLQ